jgi:hypothetical protein
MEKLMDTLGLFSSVGKHFQNSIYNISSLLQDTYSVHPSKPICLGTGTPIRLTVDRIACTLLNVNEFGLSDSQITISLEDIKIDKKAFLKTVTTLRAASLHKRKRECFQTYIASVESSLKIEFDLCIFIEKRIDNTLTKIGKVLDLQSVIIGMDSEDSALPKSFGSSVGRCSIILPILNIFLSESRLKVISKYVDEMLCALSIEKDSSRMDLPGNTEASYESNITACGRSDAFADFYVNMDMLAVTFLSDQAIHETKPVIMLGICSIMMRYYNDASKKLKVVKFGIGTTMVETYTSSDSPCIVGPAYKSSRVNLLLRSNTCKRRWARLRQTLQCANILGYFPSWVIYQVHGSVYTSGSKTTAITIQLANLGIFVDTSLYKPILEYMFNLQKSFELSRSSNIPKNSEEKGGGSSIVEKQPMASERQTSLIEMNIISFHLTLSHSDKEVAYVQCLNTTTSLYNAIECNNEAQSVTKLNVEMITVIDLVRSNNVEILTICPSTDSESRHGISVTKNVTGEENVTVVQISKIKMLFIQRFIGDVLFVVSEITNSLPTTDGTEASKDSSTSLEEKESSGESTQFLSVKGIEIFLPIYEDNHDKYFKLLFSLKVQVGGVIERSFGGVQSQPTLEICLNDLSLGFLHTYLGYHTFIERTGILCYIESVEGAQNRVLLFCSELSVNLSQLIYGHLMEFLSGNLADTSIFSIVVAEEVVLRDKEDFKESAYKYQESIDFPKEEVLSLEVCISSSKWNVSFQDSDSPVQFGVITFLSPSFAYRTMSTGNTHICIDSHSFCLKDTDTSHALTDIIKGKGEAAEGNQSTEGGAFYPSFQFILVMQKNGPMIIELKLKNNHISWPYFKDMSFLTKILSVLKSNESEDRGKPIILTSPEMSKWFYFNLVANNTKIFVPLKLDISGATSNKQKDGIMIKTETLQFRYGAGGDGESAIKVRAYDFQAAFALGKSPPHKEFLLPFSFCVEMSTSVPTFDEEIMKTKKILVIRKLQRWWRQNHSYESTSSRSLQRNASFTQITNRKAFILEHGINPNERETSLSTIKISIDEIVFRAAMSEVQLWNRLLALLNKPPENAESDETGSEGAPDTLRDIVFRPSSMEVDLRINCVSLVVCDDRPRTYGDPDVLRLYAKSCTLNYKVDCQEEDSGSKTSAEVKVALSVEYLDSSISRYANIILPWEIKIEFHQEDDTYSGRNNSLWLDSEERLDIHISPHILLALGDVMTFTTMLAAEKPGEYTRKSLLSRESDTASEQEAAPQKYCLNNYSGVSLWYWSSPQTTAHRVSDGRRVIVKEKPYLAKKSMYSKGSKSISGSSVIQFECLNLQFEGNWSPLLEVNVSLVGKYNYMLQAPLDNIEVPVVVDIVLVGRTKVISVHSPYWIFNRSDRDLIFRLQLYLGYLNAPSSQIAELASSDTMRDEAATKDVSSDLTIGPIESGTGFYLPITSSIMHKSVLFVRSADGLLESTSHNIRILDVDKMDNQQQMIECEAAADAVARTPTHQLPVFGQDLLTSSEVSQEENPASVQSVIPLSDITISEKDCEDSNDEELDTWSLIDLDEVVEDQTDISTPDCASPQISEMVEESAPSFFCNLRVMKVSQYQVHLPSYKMDSHGLSASSSPIECELSFQPPLVINNALPYDIEINLVDMKEGYQSQQEIVRTSSSGSDRKFKKSRSSQFLTVGGLVLKPGMKADIYCDLQKKQKLTIKVNTAAQGMLKTQSAVVIHDGNLINDVKRQTLPNYAMLHPFIQTTDPNDQSEVSEIELTSAVFRDYEGTPSGSTPGRDSTTGRYSGMGGMNKRKVKIGIENVPTGLIGRKVTIYSPYWIDNQTGSDLLFSENNSLPLFGRIRRSDEIFVPAFDESESQDMPIPLPVLLNTEQQRIFFRIAGAKSSPYGPSVNIKRAGPSGHNPIPISESLVGGQNARDSRCSLFHFAVDIVPCPADSIYNKTKVISVKTAIIIENMSSFSIVYRQSGQNEDAEHFAVASGQSINHKWQCVYSPLEITIRPGGSIWNWSSSFPLLGTGDIYFGLRLSHQEQEDVFLIIPVSITVSTTHILVSFKDPSAEPPYRIQNDCKEVCLKFKQVEDKKQSEANAEEDERDSLIETNPETTVSPGTSISYAWDVPTWPHKLSVNLMKDDLSEVGAVVEYRLDDLGDRKPITLSDSKRSGSRSFIPTPSFSMKKKEREKQATTHLEKKLKAVLAKELASKVFVSVYADGPTRVLKFSDKKDSASIQAELSMLEMHTRLRKLEDELANNVNKKFASLMGYMKSRPTKIDLYGRNSRFLDSYLKMSSSVIDKWKAQKTPGRRKMEAQHQAKLRSSKSSKRPPKITQDILVDEMKDSIEGDNSTAILSLGGELTVTVHTANDLTGNPQTTHTYAEIDLEGQSYQTNIALQTCNPVWEESFSFPNARATNFLDLSIFKVNANSCAPVRKTSKRFLGSVRIPLLESFTMESNESIGYTLGRQQGTDEVKGEVVISLSWRTNANSLMQLKVDTLEEILAQRMEILAQLKPLSAEEWDLRIANNKKREALIHHLGYQKGELQVTVIAARNLHRRSSFQPLGALDFSIEGPLCNPFVLVKYSRSEEETVYSTNVVDQSLEPLFDKTRKFKFEGVPLSGSITFELYDKNPLGRPDLLGSRTVHCSEISTSISTPFNPVYAWIRLKNSKKHILTEESPEINVRMQWNPPSTAVRNVTSMNITLSSIGIALISGVLGGELINTTLDKIKLRQVRDDKETTFAGSIQKIQIDNQLPNSVQPVILRGLNSMGNQVDFLNIRFCEVFSSKSDKANIRSIKDFKIDFGDLQIEVDDLFMDAILKFVQALPIRDLYQDDEWNARQDCMLNFSLPFGPPEIHDLCGDRGEETFFVEGFAHPTEWYRKKASDQVRAMRALSSSSSWYFIERAEIGSLRVILSLSIASQVLAGSEGEKKSLLNRSLNTSGLQLIDVDNANLQISGLTLSEEVIGVNALKLRLQQHLQWQIISEAHKVLGGSGPAIIGAPLSVLYAFSSAYTIGQEITTGRVGPAVAAQQLGYVAFSAVSQAISAFSTTLILVLAVIPTDEDHGDWADKQTLKRYSGKAINAPKSLYTGFKEVFTGTVRGLSGFLTDPVWACQKGGVLLLPAGLVKGLLGVPIRPLAGLLEGASRVSQGIGLLCLGKEGIEGILPHRVRAPEVFQEQAQIKGIAESDHEETLMKWKETLVKLAPELDKDALVHYLELDQASSKRRNTLLFTEHKIVLIGSFEKRKRLKFFLHWILAGTAVKQVLGKEEKFKIKLIHIIRFPTACCGEWAFPSTKVIQCATKDIFSETISLINVHRGSETSKPVSKELSIDKNVEVGLVPKSYFLTSS